MTIDLKTLFNLDPSLDDRMITEILKAFKDANTSNFDYIRFKQSVESLLKMNMDEATSIKSAYATVSTMGYTKEELVNSVQQYLNILKKERVEFITALKAKIEGNVEGPKSKIEELNARIHKNENKMEELKQENEILKGNINQIKAEIDTDQSRIDQTKERFLNVYNVFEQELESDKLKYTSNLY